MRTGKAASEEVFCPGMTAPKSQKKNRQKNFIKFCIREKFDYNLSTPNFS
jgi:hypothetical protein